MADLSLIDAHLVTNVPVDASATTFLVGDFLSNDGSGNWVKADADVAARQDAQWICMNSVGPTSAGTATYSMPVCKRGIFRDTDAPYTAGALMYLSATAGLHTATVPTIGIATVRKVVGKAVTTSIVILNTEVPHYYPSVHEALNASMGNCPFFIAPKPLRVLEARATWKTAFAAAVTIDVVKAASGTDVDSGTVVLTGAFAGDGAGDTTNALGASTTAATARLATGNVLGLDYSATTTGVGLAVTVTLVDEQLI